MGREFEDAIISSILEKAEREGIEIIKAKYIASGKKDTSCYTEETVIADYNVFACYDSQSCKPKFYEGHFDEDFDYVQAEPTAETLEGYIEYLTKNDDELPANFYQRRKSA